MRDPIVVTGIALDAPFGSGLDGLWDLLDGPQPQAAQVRRFPVDGCRVTRAHLHWSSGGIGPLAEAACATAAGALAAAGLPRERTKDRIGLAIGSISSPEPAAKADAWITPELRPAANALGQHCIERLGLQGPLVHVVSACTSSAAALFWARALLENDDADVMLVGGIDRIRPLDFAGFNVLRAMDPDGARPFHAQRRGIVMGEGACFLVLEREAGAIGRDAPIRAVFAGAGLSSDAHHPTAPLSQGLAAAGREALRTAGLGPRDIQYVNCHGTGTVANDKEELKALVALFGAELGGVSVGSTKGFTGHWLGSSGALEAAIAVSVLERQAVPTMPWLTDGETILAGLTRTDEARRPISHVMSNNLGFGGNNTSLVFSKFSPKKTRRSRP